MQPDPSELQTCRVCGEALQSANRYCPNCGTPTAEPVASDEPDSTDSSQVPGGEAATDSFVIHPRPEQPDPSTLETREFHVEDTPPSLPHYVEPEPTLFEPTATTVPPESGNRTLWIILGIVAVIVLVCCCLLPLGLLAVANMDTTFQDELRSFASQTFL